MEERKLRLHLIRIYVVTIAAILAALLAAILLFSVREIEQKNRETFTTLLTALGDELQTNNIVRHSELRRQEQENRLFLLVKDNGEALLYNSLDGTGKEDLLKIIEQAAREEGFDTQSLPLTNARRTSPVRPYSVNGERYLGAVSILPLANGYRTLTLAQRLDASWSGSVAFYCVLYFGGVFLLGGVGVMLIDRALQPALESRKRQNQFIAAASHELRSPLAVISANAEMLPIVTPEGAATAGIITAECARMSRLIGDLLMLASADAKSWTFIPEPIELDTLLLNVYEAYVPLYRKSGCTLELRLPENSLARVRGDAERLKQVLGILLENALSYGVTQDRRSVELSVSTQRQRVSICVADHGDGLSTEQKAHVFDRFYRADTSRREKQHFGLGLSVAQELVALQKGTLDVFDTAGGGCTFRILLG